MMLLLSLLLNILLTPVIGLNGSAIATAIGMGGLNVFGLIVTWKRLKMWPYDMRYFKGFIATLITLSALVIFRKINPQWSIYNLFLQGMISGCVMLVSLLILRLDQEDFAFFRAMKRILLITNLGRMKNE